VFTILSKEEKEVKNEIGKSGKNRKVLASAIWKTKTYPKKKS